MVQIKLGILLKVPLLSQQLTSVKASIVKRDSKRSERKIGETNVLECSLNRYDVDKPIGTFHIEYTLFPNAPKYSIDIVYWDAISKIYTEDGMVAYRHYVINEKIWIPVMLKHTMNEFNIEKLKVLHNYAFEVVISTKKTKLSKEAKNEKVKSFFIHMENVGKIGFLEAFEYNPNEVSSNENHPIFQSSDEMTTKIYSFEKGILYPTILKIIADIEQNKNIYTKNYIPNAPEASIEKPYIDYKDVEMLYLETSKDKLKNDPDRSEKGKPKLKEKLQDTDVKIQISGETFFTDPNLSIYTSNGHNEILDKSFIILSVYNLLSAPAILELEPLIIKLKRIKNIPVDCLISEGYNSLQLSYDVPYIAQSTTNELEIENLINVNESHCIFNTPSEKLIEFLQSQKLLIKLLGNRNLSPEIPKMFGKDINDYRNKQIKNTDEYLEELPSTITLGIASFDLSSLLKSVYIYEQSSNFRNPNHILVQDKNSMIDRKTYKHVISISEINETIPEISKKRQSPISDQMFLDFGTELEIEIDIKSPIYGLTPMLSNPIYFTRMLLIIYREQVASVLVNEIQLHNQLFYPEIVLPNYLQYHIKSSSNLDMVSGFFVDNGNSYILFIEGNTCNYCREMIWSQVKNLNESVCKILSNSEYVFSDRIYSTFLNIGGLYKITLQHQLQDIFKIPYNFLKTCVPQPCFQAIQKLDLILRYSTFREINQNCLFPTCNELMSLDMEFGLPYRLSKPLSVESINTLESETVSSNKTEVTPTSQTLSDS